MFPAVAAVVIAIPLGLDAYLPVPEDNRSLPQLYNSAASCSMTNGFRGTGAFHARLSRPETSLLGR